MRQRRLAKVGIGLFTLLVSCAIITVNIYFPEKDVKEAYKVLEKELMTPQEMKPEGKPEEKPQTSSRNLLRFEWIAPAYAQVSELADQIADIVKKMPDVVAAYRQMGQRLPQTERLRDSGAVGEGKNGLLVVRDEKLLTPADRALVAAENENRRTVMSGMAKAIVRLNRVPENDQNLKQVMPQAVEQFAAIRQSSAKKGWWVQDTYGNWTRK